MHTNIGTAVDLLEHMDGTSPATEDAESLARVLQLVQQNYLEIIKEALSLLMQDERDKCNIFLQQERTKLEPVKERIRSLLGDSHRWQHEFLKLSIEYLFTRARLVDELKLFPNFTLELLERHTLDKTLEETISYLETAMTGKQKLFEQLIKLQPL